MRPLLPRGAGSAVLDRASACDHRVPTSILSRSPTAPGLPRRTGGTLLLPIHHQRLGGKPSPLVRLPMVIVSAWAKEIPSKIALASDELLCIDLTRIDQMHGGEKIVRLEGFVDTGKRSKIGGRCRRGFDMGHQVRTLFITRFGQMHVVPDPTRVTLFGVMGLRVRRRVHPLSCNGSSVGLSPAQFSLLPKKRRYPDAAPCLSGGYVPDPCRSFWIRDRLSPVPSIVADHQSLFLAGLLAVGESVIFDAVLVSFDPTLLPLPQEPLWSRDCQGIERGTKGFPNSLDAIEAANLRQDRSRVAALSSTGFARPSFSQPHQEQITDSLLLVFRHEALAKLGEDTLITAGIIEVSAEQILPIQSPTNRIGGLPIRKVLQKWHHTHQSQSPRRFGRLPILRIPVGNILIVGDSSPSVPQRKGDLPFRVGRARHSDGFLRHGTHRLGFE